jgi:hypothetical protein
MCAFHKSLIAIVNLGKSHSVYAATSSAMRQAPKNNAGARVKYPKTIKSMPALDSLTIISQDDDPALMDAALHYAALVSESGAWYGDSPSEISAVRLLAAEAYDSSLGNKQVSQTPSDMVLDQVTHI